MEWKPIETAELGKMVLLYHPAWRHVFAGVPNGDDGACWVDTCEPEAKGWQTFATHWMLLPPPPQTEPKPISTEAKSTQKL
jgi:hypothetical protein